MFYKSVRDRQDEPDADLDLELESTSDSTTRPLPVRAKSTSRSAINQRASPQAHATNYPYGSPLTPFSVEKREFDYDFVSQIRSSRS